MSEGFASEKEFLRKEIRQRLRQLSGGELAETTQAICARLKHQHLWGTAKSMLFFAPLQSEPDIWPLVAPALAEGKMVCLPRFDAAASAYEICQIRDPAAGLRTGKFGIREPGPACAKYPLKRLDLILVPGLAFDLEGRRLGRGQGYYDRLLATLEGPTCGVAFDMQVVPHVPGEPHDVRLNCILTPTRWHEVPGPRAVLK